MFTKDFCNFLSFCSPPPSEMNELTNQQRSGKKLFVLFCFVFFWAPLQTSPGCHCTCCNPPEPDQGLLMPFPLVSLCCLQLSKNRHPSFQGNVKSLLLNHGDPETTLSCLDVQYIYYLDFRLVLPFSLFTSPSSTRPKVFSSSSSSYHFAFLLGSHGNRR